MLHDGAAIGPSRQGNQLPLAVVQLFAESVDFGAHFEPRVQVDGDPVDDVQRFLGPVDVVFGFV